MHIGFLTILGLDGVTTMFYTQQHTEEIKQYVRNTFPKRLKSLREASGLSQDAFAKALGVSRAAIGYYENGERLPDIAFLAAICRRTECDINYLIGYSDTMASYAHFNISGEYDLSDNDMEKLESLLENDIFKIVMANDKFLDFFKELKCLSFRMPHNKETRAIIEYLCVGSLSRLIGQAFLEYTPGYKNPEIEKLLSDSQKHTFDEINLLISEGFESQEEKEECKREIDDMIKNDPFYRFRTSMIRLQRGETNAET